MSSTAVCDDELCDATSTCADLLSVPSCGGSCCTPWCDLGDPGADADCAALDPLLACEPYYEPGAAPPGLETLGTCIAAP